MISISSEGKIIINNIKASSILSAFQKDTDPDFGKKPISQLISIFSKKNPEDMVIASLISNLSTDDRIPNIAWLTIHKGKDYYQYTKKVIDSFDQTLQILLKPQQYTRDSLLYKLNNMLAKGEVDFTEINKYIGNLMYKQFFPDKKSPTKTALDNFTYLPGIAESIFTLRKLYFVSVTNEIVTRRQVGNQRLIINPGVDIWNKVSSMFDIYGKNSINPINLKDLSSDDLINHLVFFVIEGKIASHQAEFSKKEISINERGSELTILSFLFPNDEERIVNFHGVQVPINTYLSGTKPVGDIDFSNKLDDVFLSIFFGSYRISSIYIPKIYEQLE